ncbi:uncharacterized protein EKO05_0001791 [Ascochyta rabiei]|uniref:uncharacterized protein n=1 Tax=Didymella rabiei TaxID=5454 RepID=UPI002205E046|nr:uncharacterized protein EKO05_0001791 [Ascochyta rabiei]UPX11169.1 hypothetical protein EKO05_0001791 [Ascochyta rabiei]
MSGATVTRLVITAPSACQSQVLTWDKIAQQLRGGQTQIIFASTKSFVDTAPQLRGSLEKQLNIPRYFFDRLYLQSNGFAGHHVRLDCDGKVEGYTHWSRFIVKQTYNILLPKRTFTPHLSNYQLGHNSPIDAVAVHGPQSMQFGWEWFEMGFFLSWKSSGPLTLICFDLPPQSQSSIQKVLESRTVNLTSPHSLLVFVADELLQLYDDSVWSIRNHISQGEAVSQVI